VVFSDIETVDLVMKDKDKHEINHKIVDVKRAQARGVAPPSIHGKGTEINSSGGSDAGSVSSPFVPGAGKAIEPTPEQMQCKVFVGGLPPHVESDELKQIFEEFGTVVDAIVMMDQATQRSRCFGFVTFAAEQQDGHGGSSAAHRSVDAQPLTIHGRRVEVKLATPRAEQQGGTGPKRLAAPKHVGLRAGQSSSATSGEFAGLAVAYGRNGWKAGYGTKAFGKAGWDVWEDTMGRAPEKAGFSFDMVKMAYASSNNVAEGERPIKRSRQ
jgi:RNA recognition motif-containing protein